MIFYAVEITAYQPGTGTVAVSEGHGTMPHGALTELPVVTSTSTQILASDVGYRTAPTDSGGPVPYPPLVADAFSISRALNLDPTSSTVAAAWGSVNLSDHNSRFDAMVATWNNDGQAARVLYGTKTLDTARGLFLDPAYSTLLPVFSGVSTAWFLSDTQLQIPLRDATYWLERPIQTTLYLGTGAYEGTTAMAGTPKPKMRGTVLNVSPVLIDPTNLIYQYNDGPGSVGTLYEGGANTYGYAGDTTNLYSGSTPAGQFRTDNSRGLIQLGSSPTGQITVDATGAFPINGSQTLMVNIAYYLLIEDAALPAAYVNHSSFSALASAYPYAGGIYFDPAQQDDGVSAVDSVLSAIGAKLWPARNGVLQVMMLRALSATATAADTYSPVNTVSVVPKALPSVINPPPYRMRIGYQHNYTVQTSGLLASTSAARKVFIGASDRYAAASSNTILLSYARPNDVNPIGGYLSVEADAQQVANDLIALWGTRRRLYDVTVPLSVGIARDLGDVVNLAWPIDDLAGGKLGQVVGDAFLSTDATITLTVLI